MALLSISDPLEVLLADGIIDEVLGRLKSGKEATISLVRRGDDVIAAKVYKDRATRSFKNSVGYKEGRKVRNSRTQRAMDSGGQFGKDAAEQEWKSAEADALYRLVDCGVRVPQPHLFYEGVLLMDLVCDAEGRAAPRMIDVAIEKDNAIGVYADLCAQIISMLCCDLIHGDLSPYNILAAAAGPTIIDFPQVVSAVHNSRAEYYFLRDFDNVVGFIAGFDPALAVHRADGRAIWRAYVSRDLTPEFVPPPPPPPARRGAPTAGAPIRGARGDRRRAARVGGRVRSAATVRGRRGTAVRRGTAEGRRGTVVRRVRSVVVGPLATGGLRARPGRRSLRSATVAGGRTRAGGRVRSAMAVLRVRSGMVVDRRAKVVVRVRSALGLVHRAMPVGHRARVVGRARSARVVAGHRAMLVDRRARVAGRARSARVVAGHRAMPVGHRARVAGRARSARVVAVHRARVAGRVRSARVVVRHARAVRPRPRERRVGTSAAPAAPTPRPRARRSARPRQPARRWCTSAAARAAVHECAG